MRYTPVKTRGAKAEKPTTADTIIDGGSPKPISFRLPQDIEQALVEKAAGRGESKGEYAKRLVVAALAGQAEGHEVEDRIDGGRIEQGLSAFGEEISRLKELFRDAREENARQVEQLERRLTRAARSAQALRDDLATLAVALLTTAGGQEPSDAEAWVRRELRGTPVAADNAGKEGRGR
jgi:hypothetical protein